MRKLQFFGLLALLLVLVFTGCDSNDSSSDNWQIIGSWAELDGTWQGSANKSMTIREVIEILYNQEWTSGHQLLYGNMTARHNVVENIIINSNTMRITGTNRQTLSFSGGNIAVLWPEIRSNAINDNGTVNDSNYSVTHIITINGELTVSVPPDWRINQYGNRFRTPYLRGTSYLVFNRQ